MSTRLMTIAKDVTYPKRIGQKNLITSRKLSYRLLDTLGIKSHRKFSRKSLFRDHRLVSFILFDAFLKKGNLRGRVVVILKKEMDAYNYSCKRICSVLN